MEQALNALHTKPVNWTQPSDVKTSASYVQQAFSDFGAEFPGPSTDLYPAWYVGGNKSSSSSQTIDKVSGLVATSCTPALAKETAANSNAATWNIDIFNGGKANIGTAATNNSTAATANDNVHACSDSPPSIDVPWFINNEDATNPNNLPIDCSSSCTVTATVSAGTHPLSDPNYPQFPGTVNLLVNGQVVQSQGVSASPSTVTFSNITGSGTETIALQVIDSVLYDDQSANATVTFQAAGPSSVNAKLTGSSTTITWSGGATPFTVTDSVGGSLNCSSSGCTVSASSAPLGSTVTVTDTNGNSSNATVTH
jgi:hypothetical protein